MKEKRLQKIKDFEKFYDDSISIFTELRDKDKRVEIFQNEHMLCICPGSRAGGNEKRIIEVFWGARPYEYETKGNGWKSLTETGVTLFFYRNDTGDVTISLYPAKTEFRKPIEDYIALHEWVNPKRLNDKVFIRSLWEDFVAYMESTSLDGKPNYAQKLRIWYLRNFKHLVIKQTWMPTKFSGFIERILKIATTVIFSGAVLIYVINTMTKPSMTETEIQLREVNKQLETLSTKLDRIIKDNEDTKIIQAKIDSVAVNTDRILKTIKKVKSK